MQTSKGVSARQQRRAFLRYGPSVYAGRICKHEGNRVLSAKKRHESLSKDATMREVISRGKAKIQNFWLQAGLLVIPYGESELKTILQQAKQQFDTDGVIRVDTAMQLGASGHSVAKLEQVWGMMRDAEIDPTAFTPEPYAEDQPLNSFV